MNCVLTTASENILIGLERFLKTFRQINIIDDIIVFMPQLSEQNKQHIRNMRDIYNSKIVLYPFSFCNNISELMSKRFLLYNHWLIDKKYEKILHIDCTDVVFQDNPFKYEFIEDILFFEEKSTYENEPMNLSWLNHFPPDIVNSLLKKYILCMGSILATQEGFKKFLKYFIDIMFTNNKGIPLNFDQTVLNIMVYTNIISTLTYKTLNNEEGPIGTIGLSTAFKKLNENGLCIDENNRVIPVVHQFNRMSTDMKIQLCKSLSSPYDDFL